MCTLWRSKIGDALASGENGLGRHVTPKLRLLFRDGESGENPAEWGVWRFLGVLGHFRG